MLNKSIERTLGWDGECGWGGQNGHHEPPMAKILSGNGHVFFACWAAADVITSMGAHVCEGGGAQEHASQPDHYEEETEEEALGTLLLLTLLPQWSVIFFFSLSLSLFSCCFIKPMLFCGTAQQMVAVWIATRSFARWPPLLCGQKEEKIAIPPPPPIIYIDGEVIDMQMSTIFNDNNLNLSEMM